MWIYPDSVLSFFMGLWYVSPLVLCLRSGVSSWGYGWIGGNTLVLAGVEKKEKLGIGA